MSPVRRAALLRRTAAEVVHFPAIYPVRVKESKYFLLLTLDAYRSGPIYLSSGVVRQQKSLQSQLKVAVTTTSLHHNPI